MAASKDPAAYPFALHALVEHFGSSPRWPPVTVPFGDKAAAMKFRFTFYSFKTALKTAGKEREFNLVNAALARLITLPDGTTAVEFSPRDDQDFALALEQALVEAQLGALDAEEPGISGVGEESASAEDPLTGYLGGIK